MSSVSIAGVPLIQQPLTPQEPELDQHSGEIPTSEITISHNEVDDFFPPSSGIEAYVSEFYGATTFDDSLDAEIPHSSSEKYETGYDYQSDKLDFAPSLQLDNTHLLSSHQRALHPIESRTPPNVAILQTYGPTSDGSLKRGWWYAAVLGLLLCLIAALGVGAWYWLSHQSSSSQSSTESRTRNESSFPKEPSNLPGTESAATLETASNSGADDEFTALRDRRLTAKPSERNQIVAILKDAERKYPNDYRFPYERAKLTIVGVYAHDESFAALMRAAEIAIDNGKTEMMLDNLMADKDHDFRKLSHGHREWQVIDEALRNKNKSGLNH